MATKPFRIIAIAALACGVIQPTFSTAAPARSGGDGYPTLAGVTRVSAASSAWGVVDLPAAQRFSTSPGTGTVRGLSLQGAGRIIGIGLVSTDGRAGFVQLQFQSCWKPGCVKAGHSFAIADDWSSLKPPAPGVQTKPTNSFRLPAGHYVLSLYADGAPVHATLRLTGRSSFSRFALHLARGSHEASPAVERVGAGPVTTATESSATGTVATHTIVLGMTHEKDASAQVHDEDWWCFYDQPPPGGKPAPYCPGGSGVGIGLTWVTFNYHGLSYGLAVETGPAVTGGKVFQGVSDSGVQNVDQVHDNFLWADGGLPHQAPSG